MRRVSRRVLVVDDEMMLRRLTIAILGGEGVYEIREASDGVEALEVASQWLPDVVLLDINMPRMDGFAACEALKGGLFHPVPQVIMVSGNSALNEQLRAFDCGADDYLVKPIERLEFRSRVQLHFRLREAQAIVNKSRRKLKKRLAELRQLSSERTKETLATQDVAIFTLAKVAESRDNETGMHLTRMREYSQLLALQLRSDSPYAVEITDSFLDDLYRSSPLHDIGKVGIPDAVLLKPGKLSPEEFAIMKQHAMLGANILKQAVQQSASGTFLTMAAVIAETHHERWDGSGYPAGLAGAAIPLPGRIVALADVFDALTSKRPYKQPWTAEAARDYIEEQSGRHFDPTIVEAFRRSFADFVSIQRTCGDNGASAMGMLQLASLSTVGQSTSYLERAMAAATAGSNFLLPPTAAATG